MEKWFELRSYSQNRNDRNDNLDLPVYNHLHLWVTVMCFILDRIQWWVDVAECQLVSWQRLLSPGSGMWSAADSGSAAKCPGDDTQLPLLSSRRKLIDSCLRSKRGVFFPLWISRERRYPLWKSTVLSRHDQGQGVTKALVQLSKYYPLLCRAEWFVQHLFGGEVACLRFSPFTSTNQNLKLPWTLQRLPLLHVSATLMSSWTVYMATH